jgi:hypothetical protein
MAVKLLAGAIVAGCFILALAIILSQPRYVMTPDGKEGAYRLNTVNGKLHYCVYAECTEVIKAD